MLPCELHPIRCSLEIQAVHHLSLDSDLELLILTLILELLSKRHEVTHFVNIGRNVLLYFLLAVISQK